MIDIENLLKSSCVKVSVPKIEITPKFVREFREKNSISQSILASIFCVTKKTVEKWEKGEKKVKGSASVLFKVLDNNPEILSQIYSVQHKKRERKEEKE